MKSFLIFLVFIFSTSAFADAMSVATRMKAATDAYRGANYDKVIELLNPYTDELENPGLMMLASSYSKKGKYAEEVRVLTVMAANNDKNFEAQMLLAQAYMKQSMVTKDKDASKQLDGQAIVAFRKCLHLRPNFKPAFDELMTVMLHSGDPKDAADARDLLSDGLEKYGHRPELMKEMCRLDSMQGYVSQAVKSCHEAIHAAPGFPDSYVYLAQSLFDEEETTAGERELVDAAKRFPASEFVQWSAGTVYFRKKNYPVSARYFGQAVKSDPQSWRSEFGYAQSLYEGGREKEALPYFQQACKKNPKDVTDAFLAASSRLRAKGNPLGDRYKEIASECHTR